MPDPTPAPAPAPVAPVVVDADPPQRFGATVTAPKTVMLMLFAALFGGGASHVWASSTYGRAPEAPPWLTRAEVQEVAAATASDAAKRAESSAAQALAAHQRETQIVQAQLSAQLADLKASTDRLAAITQALQVELAKSAPR